MASDTGTGGSGGDGGTGGDGGGGGGGAADDLPGLRARVSELTRERRELRAALDAAKEATGRLSAMETDLATARATLDTERAARAEERDLWRAGLVDGEAQVVARALYGQLPEGKDRPASIGAWLESLRAEGATVPRALAGYMQPPGSGTGGKPPPPPPRGDGRPPPSGAPADATAIRTAREDWQRAGSPSTGPSYDRLRALLDSRSARA